MAPSWLRRLHGLLLRAYDAPFRRDYTDELEAILDARYARCATRAARLRVATAALLSAVWNGLATRRRGVDARGWTADGAHAWRAATRAPGHSLLVATVIGGSLAATIVVVGVVDTLLIRATPYAQPERLAFVWGSNPLRGQVRDVISGPNALDLMRAAHTFEVLAAFKQDEIVVRRDRRPQVVGGLLVTPGFLRVLGTEPALGRAFRPADSVAGAEPVVVLGNSLWRDMFAADPDIIGSRLPVKDGFVTVVGVLGDDFSFPVAGAVLIPLDVDQIATHDRTSFNYWMVGRLQEGRTFAEADAELDGLMRQIVEGHPRLEGWSVRVEPLANVMTAATRPALLAVGVGVGLLLAIAIANAGGLMLVRAVEQRSQVALRAALGASRLRLVRLVVLHALVLGAFAITIAVPLARMGFALLPGIIPPTVAVPGSAAQIAVRYPTLTVPLVLAAVVLAAVVALAAAVPWVIAATAASRATDSLRGTRTTSPSRRGNRAHDALVVAEIGVAVVLLVGAGLLTVTVVELLSVDSGLRTEGVLAMYVGDLDAQGTADRVAFYRQVEDAVTALPGVRAAGFSDYVPLRSEDDFEGLHFGDAPVPGAGIREEWRRISPGYVEAVGIELVAGRHFGSGDYANGASVAQVNRAFARKHFGDRSPVGEQMFVHGGVGPTEIVGVVGDVRRRGLREGAPPVFYVPYTRQTRSVMALFVRTDGHPSGAVTAIREAIWSVDSSQPVDGVTTLDQVARESIGVSRLAAVVIDGLAAAALVLSSLGVFGLMSHAVRARRREYGIRLALGAEHRSVRLLLIRRTLRLVAIGCAAGLAMAIALGRLVAGLLFGVNASEPWLLVAAAIAAASTSLLATWVPAWRIGRIAPRESLVA